MIEVWILLVVLVLFLLFFGTFFYYVLLTGIFSVPFVPTSQKDIDSVLSYAKLKKGMQFVDLGSGDGRLVMYAVKKYQVNGTGLEINPLLVWFSRLRAKLLHLDQAVFLRQDLYSFPLNNANVVYLFLLPKMMDKMAEKIKSECGKGTLIVSRGFPLPGFKKVYEIPTHTFETYFYRV